MTLTTEQEKAVAAHRLELERRGVTADDLSDDEVLWRRHAEDADLCRLARKSWVIAATVRRTEPPAPWASTTFMRCDCRDDRPVSLRHRLAFTTGIQCPAEDGHELWDYWLGFCHTCRTAYFAARWRESIRRTPGAAR